MFDVHLFKNSGLKAWCGRPNFEDGGAVVFVGACARYPVGHYLVRDCARANGLWMNPWINAPQMIPVQAGFETQLPVAAEYVIWETPNT
ncbi:hypothetical protein WDW86_14620 [Bdellovibrionota bacterium FG-2]